MPFRSSWIFGRDEERGPKRVGRGVPSWHLGPNRNPEGSVADGGEVAQKAMQIDNGFLRGDAKQGVNEGTLTSTSPFASQRTCPLRVMCIDSYLCMANRHILGQFTNSPCTG